MLGQWPAGLVERLVDSFELTVRSPLAVVLCVLCWELVYRLFGVLCRAAAPGLVRPEYAKGSKALASLGGSYACAFLHSVVTGFRGVWHIVELYGAPIDAKLSVPSDPLAPGAGAAAATELTFLLFFSWLVYDTCHVIAWWPVRRGALPHSCRSSVMSSS